MLFRSIPMRGLVSACAVGKVGGKIVLDLNKPEDNYGEADLPIAMTEDGKITLVQMDGHLTPDEFTEAMELVQKGCRQVLEIQKAALLEKYASVMDDDSDIEEIEVDSESGDVTDDMVDDFVSQVSERLARDVSAVIREYEESGEITTETIELFEEDVDLVVIDEDDSDVDFIEIDEMISDFDDDDFDLDDDEIDIEESDEEEESDKAGDFETDSADDDDFDEEEEE